ncbi:hypothetical protein JZ751_026209 [Albula glossodonta]|uniref:Sulfotransferase n=1 Tax=Albula glossodonta TaxID=121402 RepID=A0A8T2PDQ3_9TELE|nr:hypothetical protein JZ751_026209 [Albula glossodonta]
MTNTAGLALYEFSRSVGGVQHWGGAVSAAGPLSAITGQAPVVPFCRHFIQQRANSGEDEIPPPPNRGSIGPLMTSGGTRSGHLPAPDSEVCASRDRLLSGAHILQRAACPVPAKLITQAVWPAGDSGHTVSRGGKIAQRGMKLTLQLYIRARDLMPSTLEGQITMEKTPSYFVTNDAPKRIHSMARDTKLIIVVRNPVTRAISDYTQTLSKRPEIPTFEVLAFKNRTLGLIDASWSALRIGIYALHLESWMQYFPLSQIHFVSGERLIVDPAGEMAKVQDFLGLKRIVTDKHFYFNKTKGFPCLKKPEDSSAPRCLGKSKGRTHPKIDPDVIRRLHKFYKPFNMMFYQMTGQNFQWEQEENQ